MTDQLTADHLPVTEAVKDVFHERVSYHSVRRWIAKGVGRPAVKLPALRIGCKYFVTRADCEAFIAAAADPGLYARSKITEANEKAKRRLIAAGA